jgi:hypothetical protein
MLAGIGQADAIVTQPPGYSIRVKPQHLDADLCSALVVESRSAAQRGATRECVSILRSALALYDGEVLAGVPSALVQAKAVRLKEEQLRILEECLGLELKLGRHREVIGELRDLAAQYPLREHPQGLLMLALYRSGRQAESLEVYRETRSRLIQELGLEPGEELRNLEKAVLANDRNLAIEPDSTAGRQQVSPAEIPETPVNGEGLTGRGDVLRALEELILDAHAGVDAPHSAVVVAVVGAESRIGKASLAAYLAEHIRGERFGHE